MGIALSNLSAFSSPLRTLTRWLQSARCLSMDSDSGPQRLRNHLNHPRPSPRDETTQAQPYRRPSSEGGVRPLRGNWPFTVNPPAPLPENNARFISSESSCFPVRDRIKDSSPAWMDAGAGRGATRVLPRPTAFYAGTGRVAIAGRMADVCAELDRMAACEAALQAY
jgi:hypothetical protein